MTIEKDTGDASENGASSAPGAANSAARAPARTSLEEFSELLREADGGDDDAANGDESPDDAGDEPARGKPKKPKVLSDVAATLGVKESELYSVEIPSSRAGEKPYTLGGLKDLAKQRDDFAIASLKLDEDRRTHEREKVSAEEELHEVLQALPAEALTEAAMKKIRGRLEAKRAQARAGILEAIPEWKEPTVRESELKGITEHLKGYGIPESFILANLNANVLRFVRDSVQRADKVRRALEAVEERRGKVPPTGKKSSPKTGAEHKGNAPNGRVGGEVAKFKQAFTDYKRRSH
jgi:hypothetical protein